MTGWEAGRGPTVMPLDGALVSSSLSPQGLFPSYPYITWNVGGPRALPLALALVPASFPVMLSPSPLFGPRGA